MRQNRIAPSATNRRFWEINGTPTLLFGGSNTHNLFQWHGAKLTEHLDLLVECGGNYVRNTMSDREAHGVPAFAAGPDGVFDLESWNDEYWERLSSFLDETGKRGIVVHLTLWDQHDLSQALWEHHPWNPACNVNYDATALSDAKVFFRTVDDGNSVLIGYQRRFVERVLETTLPYGHVLYNIGNEAWTGVAWERYWADLIHERAAAMGVSAYVTAMHIAPETTVRSTISNRRSFDFADVSQVNQEAMGRMGRRHMDSLLLWRSLIPEADPFPMTIEKVYGGGDRDDRQFGSTRMAQHRYWRNVFGGCSSVRFHRPIKEGWAGLGLTEPAQAMIRSMRLFVEAFDVTRAAPHDAIITEPGEDGPYCLARLGAAYAFLFLNGGSVTFDPWFDLPSFHCRWLDVDASRWSDREEQIAVDWHEYTIWTGESARVPRYGRATLRAPGDGIWVAVLTPTFETAS